MKRERFFELMNQLDDDLLLRADELEAKPVRKKNFYIVWGAVAACLCILALSSALILPGNSPQPPVDSSPTTSVIVNHTPVPLDHSAAFGQLSGSSLAYVKGSSTSLSSTSSSPPLYRFNSANFVVRVKAVDALPDEYYELDVSSEKSPTAYRLVVCDVLEVIHGELEISQFLFQISSYLYVDFTQYDSLIISLSHVGVSDYYVLRNKVQNRMESFSLPVFSSHNPQLGNVIAFSDGVLDETFWQNKGWRGGDFLSRGLKDMWNGDLVAYRGCSETETVEILQRCIATRIATTGEAYVPPVFLSADFEDEDARAALAYVKPFDNGVFSQSRRVNPKGNTELVFCRYANGCQTEETVIIDLVTEEVTYSEVRYTEEDFSSMEDLGFHIAKAADQYRQQIPTPPRVDPEGKNLRTLCLYGWYAKVDGKVYGVIKTVWVYEVFSDGGMTATRWYDDTYVLYDGAEGTATFIVREDLIALIGNRNIYRGEYNAAKLIPMC
ncbi:MAG: hypothetical protein J6C26_02430 [Clostridia bacterium]|nr:hypothetical protein [Clostridia bacterium]